MKHFKFIVLVCSFLFLNLSCEQDSKIEKEIAAIDVDIAIERFDKLYNETTESTFPKLKKTFPFIFPSEVSDSVWIAKIKDTLQQQLRQATITTFKDESELTFELTSFFQHLKYYYKTFREPRVITVTNNVRYRDKVIVTDSIVLVALDTYLGSAHEFYGNIPKYLKQNFKSSQIVVDLASAYAEKYAFQSKKSTLLDEMIYHGKLLYFKEKTIPFKTEAEQIGYSQEQLNWSKANESYIWRYFIERELLYSTDSKLPSRFIIDAPFSKFYLEKIDRESPGKIGQYIGWQIVKSYMKNNDISFQDMMQKEAEDIFNKSKFKPKK